MAKKTLAKLKADYDAAFHHFDAAAEQAVESSRADAIALRAVCAAYKKFMAARNAYFNSIKK